MMQTQEYKVKAPDGRIIKVRGPAGASPEEVIAQAKRLSAAKPEPAKGVGAKPTMDQQLVNAARVAAAAMRIDPAAVDTPLGAVKDVLEGGFNVGRMIPGVRSLLPEQKPDFLTRQGTAQKVGAGLATMAEFMGPSAAVGKIPAIAKASLPIRAAVEGLIGGGVSKARGESNEDAAKTALLSSGLTGAFGLLVKAAKPVGERIEFALLKPLKAEVEQVKAPKGEGAKVMIQNVYRYDLGGTLAQSYQKATERLNGWGSQLRAIIGSKPSSQVDLLQVLSDTSKELGSATAKNFGTNAANKRALDMLLEEVTQVTASGKVNLADAQEIKQALGVIGSWTNGNRTPESTALETVANAMYSKLRGAIESAAGAEGPQVKELNRLMGDVIPIRNAIIKRLPVAQRREILSLKEALALARGDLTGMGLAVMDRGLRSGLAANALVQTSKQGLLPSSIAAQSITGAVSSRNQPKP